MCISQEHAYGTVLRILEFAQLPDGRSRVDTVGGISLNQTCGLLAWVMC